MGIPDPGCCGGWFRAKIVPGKPSGAAFRVGPNNLALYRATPARPNADGRSFDPHGKMPVRAPVAQLDRVLVSEAKGHRFDSCRARHFTALSCRPERDANRSVLIAAPTEVYGNG